MNAPSAGSGGGLPKGGGGGNSQQTLLAMSPVIVISNQGTAIVKTEQMACKPVKIAYFFHL